MGNVVKRLFDYYANNNVWALDNFFAINRHIKCYGIICEKQRNGVWQDVIWRMRGVPYGETRDAEEASTDDMRKLVRMWRDAGWFVSRGRDDKWGHTMYLFSKTPFTQYGYRVVNDFIDTI